MPTSSNTDPGVAGGGGGAGQPSEAACPICGGMGLVTRNVPVGHPDFGKAFPCVCQHENMQARRNARLRELSNLAPFAEKRFETFRTEIENFTEAQLNILRSSLDIAREYALAPRGWLLFEGNYGSGKTHLAAAIANVVLERGEQVMFVTAPDLLDHLRATYGPSSEIEYDDLFDRVRNVDLLVLDDLGAESATPWAQEKLYQLVNHRYHLRLKTIFTTNCALDQLDPRIRSRLVDHNLTRVIKMDVPDFRQIADSTPQQNVLSNLRLYGDMVFETFHVQKRGLPDQETRNLKMAFERSLAFARDPQGWLVLMGGHGVGKTHLAASIANHCQRDGLSVMFVTVANLLDYLRAAFNARPGDSLDQRFEEIKEAPLLILDNFDLSSASAWALEKMHQIIDYRYLAHLPTVFTTTQQFHELDGRVRSRFQDGRLCRVLALVVPDYSGGVQPGGRGSR